MPLPDYSKKKADLRRKSHSSVELALDSLPMDDGRRRSSGNMMYDMGFNLELEHNRNYNEPMNDVSQLEDSMASLQADALGDDDQFYEEEESVTEHYDDSAEFDESGPKMRGGRLYGGGLSRSVNDVHVRLPANPRRCSTKMNKSMTDLSLERSLERSAGSLDVSKKSANSGKLENFLDKSKEHQLQRQRKRTSLLPGSTTEDLTNEMNEVVSMLSAKRSGTNRRTDRGTTTTGGGPSLPSNVSRRNRDGSHPRSPGGAGAGGEGSSKRRMTPRRSQTGDNLPTIKQSPRALPPKSRSAEGTTMKRRILGRTNSGDKHTSSSFVTGSRIRRIQPGGQPRTDLGASSSSFGRDPIRSISPRRRPVPKAAAAEKDVPALIYS